VFISQKPDFIINFALKLPNGVAMRLATFRAKPMATCIENRVFYTGRG